MNVYFEIPGEPAGKGRPRFTRNGHTYTPKETVSYENLVKIIFRQNFPQLMPSENRLKVVIDAYFTIPKSFSKKKKELAYDALISPTKKPDCDNIAKIILDALNGIAYKDDKQVVKLQVNKYYSEQPCVLVQIKDF